VAVVRCGISPTPGAATAVRISNTQIQQPKKRSYASFCPIRFIE
jgi:hypothetical protein